MSVNATKSKLALLGGEPEVTGYDKSLFHWPIVTEEDEQAVIQVMRDGNMSNVDVTMKFEKAYSEWVGTRYGLGYCNGTASLFAAMWAVGVGAGDEIICPSMTYWASCSGAFQLGATVNFADIEPDTLCIDPDDIEHRIGPRTKAIVVVHYGGHPCDMDRISPIAKKHGLKIIEDVSHAHGGLYKGKPVGTLGDVAGMSMMGAKSFAIGEGGMLLTDDRDIYERAIAFGHYERTKTSWNFKEPQVSGELLKFAGLPISGAKHRMNQTCSAMGLVQLKYYPERMAEIDRAMNRFWDLLEGVPGLKAHRPSKDSGSTMGGWYAAKGLYRADQLGGLPCAKFCEAVGAEGIGARPGANTPLHLHPTFCEADVFNQGKPTAIAFGQRDVRQGGGTLPVSESTTDIAFSVPWFKHDRPEAIEMYARAFRKVAENAADLL